MRIALVNMPFAALYMPSIALTQLRSVVQPEFSVEIHYLNHELADFLGAPAYSLVTEGKGSFESGFGDWYFRQEAFPDQPDNTAEFLETFGATLPEDVLNGWVRVLRPRRARLGEWLESVIDRHRLHEADVVGFTSMFYQTVPSLALARRLKERRPDLTVVMGGANCEAPMGRTLVEHAPQVDFAFSGSALVSFPRFLRARAAGDLEACRRMDGVFARGAQVGDRAEELPLDVPVPLDYDSFLDSFEARFARHGVQPFLLFETSRGCWWGQRAHCTFCGLNGSTMAYRAMPAAGARDLLQGLIDRYGQRTRRLSTVDNLLPKDYPREVFDHLQVPEHLSFFLEIRSDLAEEDLQRLARARVHSVQPGIEALDTSTLKRMRKGISAFQNLALLKALKRHGMTPTWNLIVGFPGEPEAVYEKYVEELPRLAHLPPPVGAFPVRYDRYSPYHAQRERYGLDLSPVAHYRLTWPFPEETLAELAYFFADRTPHAALGPWLPRLEEAVGRWQQRWFSDPRPVLQLDPSGTLRDTRQTPTEYTLSPEAQDLLRRLEEPQQVPDSPALDELRGRGLLFGENGRWMSLLG